jgi:hypothetical protein
MIRALLDLIRLTSLQAHKGVFLKARLCHVHK